MSDATKWTARATCPVTGYGFWYPTLAETVRSYRVTVTSYRDGAWQAVPS